MSKFTKRSNGQEVMDNLTCSGKIVHQALKELDFINHWLGGNKITLNGISKLLPKEISGNSVSVVDIGCGSGSILTKIRASIKRNGIRFRLLGYDANPNMIAYAETNCEDSDEIIFRTENIFQASFRSQRFDIINATLFLHHFTTDELIELLKALKKQARVGIVINDLHRHPLAYYSIKVLTSIFSKSTMVKFDAPLSVLRGFKKKEWIEILDKAGITNYSLTWRWAFRWQLIIPAG